MEEAKVDEEKTEVCSELFLDVRSSEVNIALLNNKRLVELSTEYSNVDFSVGDIYLGRVNKIMPGLNAAFIDVGYRKDAFLHYLDLGSGFLTLKKFVRMGMTKNVNGLTNLKPEPEIDKRGKIADMLKVGEYVLVQIAKEPISSKGPRLTCELSIAGRNLVLLPFNNRISVSQKIKSSETRKRMRSWIENLVPQNFGVIVRTVAQDKNVVELDKELTSLLDKWKALYEQLSLVNPPSVVHGEMDRTSAFLRDMLNSSFHQIVVNDADMYNEVKKFISEIAPDKTKIVKLYTDRTPIFDNYGIEKQIKTAFGRTVPMRSGAYIVIDHTEAGHVIDVNSGTRAYSKNDQETNALEVNLIAAEEIARQLRLRDMGGIIVIDFIDVHDSESKKAIYDKMKECMANDRAKYHLTQLSRFCLMEITRQRVRPETDKKTAETCPCCNGTGKIQASLNLTDEIENQLKYIIKKHKVKKVLIRTHPFVEAYINKGLFKSMRKQWQKLHGCRIEVLPMMAYSYMEYHFFNELEEELM
jgi:ribonuclease G